MKRWHSALIGFALLGSVGVFFAWDLKPTGLANLSALLAVLGLTLGLGAISLSLAGLAAVGRSFRVLFAKRKGVDLLSANQLRIRSLIRCAYAAGAVSCLVCVVHGFQNVASVEDFYRTPAQGLVSILYAAILAECVLRPVLSTLHREAQRAADPPLPTGAFEIVLPAGGQGAGDAPATVPGSETKSVVGACS